MAQERHSGAVMPQQGRPGGEFRLPGRGADQHLGEAAVTAYGPDDRHGGVRVAHQQEEGRRAVVDERVAEGRPASRCRPASTQPGRVRGTGAPIRMGPPAWSA